MIQGVYFDGKTARAQPVWIRIDPTGELTLFDEDRRRLRRLPLQEIQLSERFHHAPRRLVFPDGAYCEIADHQRLAESLALCGRRDETWLTRLSNWRGLALSLTILLAVVLWGYFIGLPWFSGFVAMQIPEAVEKQIGESALTTLDEEMLSPSGLSAEVKDAMQKRFDLLSLPSDGLRERYRLFSLSPDVESSTRYQLLFRSGDRLGANAFALPGGFIVVTDELIEIAGSEKDGTTGLMGVLAHEVGHIKLQHSLQQVIQASIVSGAVALFFGDFSTLLVTVPAALLTMEYSRDHERAADAYAVKTLHANHLATKPMADLLIAIEASHGKVDGDVHRIGDLFSTHPLTQDRVNAIEKGDMAMLN